MEDGKKPKKKLSLSAQIMIGMGLGIVAGVFFGDYCASLQIIGDAFIKLLQITILPYIIVSMILGIGGLTPDQAKLMAKKAGILLLDAEGGAAWTLLYPKFTVVIPVPNVVKIPLAYPIAGRDREFADFLSQWITLKKSSLDFPKLYDHWILGRDAEPKHPRWSVLRDVLGWVE